jgi:hypothetical protein
VALAGREVRAVGTPADQVRQVRAGAGVAGQVEVVTAALKEKMSAIYGPGAPPAAREPDRV